MSAVTRKEFEALEKRAEELETHLNDLETRFQLLYDEIHNDLYQIKAINKHGSVIEKATYHNLEDAKEKAKNYSRSPHYQKAMVFLVKDGKIVETIFEA